MQIDRHIAISAGWVAGPAFGVAMMAAQSYFNIEHFWSGVLFWGGIAVFCATLLLVFILSARERERAHMVIGPIVLILAGLLVVGAGVAWYFWPNQPITAQFQGQITAVAAFTVDNQPGMLNVIPVVDVRNTGKNSAVYVTGYVLKLQFADGAENEVPAQAVFDPITFTGPNGSVQVTPDNTLWGRNGSPPILGFASGRLWFAFNGVNFAEFGNENTKLTLIVKDSGLESYSSAIKIGDIVGPRISYMGATNPPASPPQVPAPQ